MRDNAGALESPYPGMNIFALLRRVGRTFPDRAALVLDGRESTYEDVLRSASLACAHLSQLGISRGDVVALSVANPVAYITIAMAVARLGAASLPLNTSLPQASAVLARHRVRALVRDQSMDWRDPALAQDRYLDAHDLLTPPAVGAPMPPVPPIATGVENEPWLIALSSGTTGVPKSIVHTHARAMLLANFSLVSRPQDQERVMAYGSTMITLIMNFVLRQLLTGGTTLFSLANKDGFFAAVARDRPTQIVASTGTAAQLVAYAAKSVPDSRALCQSVRSMVVAGSAVAPALYAALQQAICPQVEIIYGSAEAGVMALATPQTLAAAPHSAGRLYPWVEMEAVDELDQPLPAGVPGNLRVRSPVVVQSYAGDAEASAQVFRNGCYYPGDTGSVEAGGYLTLTGRADDLINVGGNKIDPVVIESVLDAQPGVEESVVVAVRSERGISILVALVVTDDTFDEAALKQACLERMGSAFVPARIRRTERIPRNAGGKIMRREVAASLMSPPASGASTLH